MKFKIVDEVLVSVTGNAEYVKVPDGVKEINSEVFAHHNEIKEIVLPDGIKKIQEYTFADLENLTKIKLPEDLEKIGDAAFQVCPNLTMVNFPSNLKEIGDGAFAECVNLTKIKLPDSLEIIRDYAFDSCVKLKEINFPSNSKYVGIGAFNGDKDLKITGLDLNKLDKIKFGLDLEERGLYYLTFRTDDKKNILKFEDHYETIVFNYKLVYFKKDINTLIKILLTSNIDESKILFFLIKLLILYGSLDDLNRMITLLRYTVCAPYMQELHEVIKMALECRYLEDDPSKNHLKFAEIADIYRYNYDYTELDKLLLNKTNTMNCIFCGKPALRINKERNIYICFNCNKYGRLTDFDIIKKTKRKEALKYYEEIYNELKENHYLKTKEYALYAIKFYKLNSYFIDKELYKDEEILYELIKHDSFDNWGDRGPYLKILNEEKFLKRILELDEYNKRYEENNRHKNIVLDEEDKEELREDATNNDDGWASFADDIEISDDDLIF